MKLEDRTARPRAFLRTALVAVLLAGAAQVGPAASARAGEGKPVVLLHGLLRTSSSMSRIADALTAQGFHVCNVSYPSRHFRIEELARDYVAPAIEHCFPGSAEPIDFVTHSMGGIVVRQLESTH